MKKIDPVTDKDFDKVFREKLYSIEMQPADSVWEGISKQLDINKKKRSFPVLWLAAASMAAVVGAGVWFSSQKEPMKLTGTADVNIEETIVQPAPEVAINVDIKKSLTSETKSLPSISKGILKSKKSGMSKVSSSEIAIVQTSSLKEDNPVESPVAASSRQETGYKAATKEIQAETQVLALAEPEIATEEPQVKERKIRSVGSLVNFVVSKVDKRKNKIIEFEDGDEGTMVSGLNLGLLKFQAKQ